jgi:hypothetical protein
MNFWSMVKKVSEVSPGHLKFKFQRLLKKFLYWQRKLQLYGPPYRVGTGCAMDYVGKYTVALVCSLLQNMMPLS